MNVESGACKGPISKHGVSACTDSINYTSVYNSAVTGEIKKSISLKKVGKSTYANEQTSSR